MHIAPEPPLARHRAPAADDDFLAVFDNASIPLPHWDHLGHVRAARLLVARMPLVNALDVMQVRIKMLNRANRVPETRSSGYHETLTVAFMRLVADAWIRDPGVSSLDFCIRHAELCDRRHILRYYSGELLGSPEARAGFVPPDRRELPGALRLAS